MHILGIRLVWPLNEALHVRLFVHISWKVLVRLTWTWVSRQKSTRTSHKSTLRSLTLIIPPHIDIEFFESPETSWFWDQFTSHMRYSHVTKWSPVNLCACTYVQVPPGRCLVKIHQLHWWILLFLTFDWFLNHYSYYFLLDITFFSHLLKNYWTD